MNKEDFKLKIMRQIKDPDSALSCLLRTKARRGRIKSLSRNICSSNVFLAASEFNTLVNLIFVPELVFDKDMGSVIPVDPGAHNVLFTDMHDPYYDGFMSFLDISNKAALSKIRFIEECIIEATHKPNTLSFGLRSFYVSHEDYEFYRVHDEPAMFESVDFDVANLSFSSGYDKPIKVWGGLQRNSNNGYNPYYLEYFSPIIKEVPLLSDELKDEILRRVANNYTTAWVSVGAETRLSEITESLRLTLLDQRLEQLLSAA